MVGLFLALFAVDIDVAQFSYTENQNFCEIYYSVDTKNLDFRSTGGKLAADFSIIFQVNNITDGRKFVDTVNKELTLTDTLEMKDYYDLQRYILSSNKEMEISVILIRSDGKKFTSDTTFTTKNWSDDFGISDLQISHTLVPAERSNRFVKNGYKLIPFPEREFTRRRYLLTSYMEIYGAKKDSVLLTYRIFRDGSVIDTAFNDYTVGAGEVMVVPMVFNILGYKPGNYNLIVSGDYNGENFKVNKNFIIKEITRETHLAQLPDSIFDYASFIRYISTQKEITKYNNLGRDGKKLFLARFWMRRDPDPDTRENEALKEHVNRVKYADRNFIGGIGSRKGRESDRGRIYIKYGEPDDIIRRTNLLQYEPYIIWHYFSANNWFVFQKERMRNQYRLIYSSIESEPTEPGWQNYLKPEDIKMLPDGDY